MTLLLVVKLVISCNGFPLVFRQLMRKASNRAHGFGLKMNLLCELHEVYLCGIKTNVDTTYIHYITEDSVVKREYNRVRYN